MFDRMRGYVDPYILFMFATVAVAAIVPATGQSAVIAGGAADAGIVFLFFLYGARLSPQSALDGMRRWQLQLTILLVTFAVFPIIGIGMQFAASWFLPAALVSGLLYLTVLPSTVQSSIAFTSIARGNVPAALCAASASNILGVFLSPLFAGWLLQTQGAEFSLSVFSDITLQLLAPFVMGQIMRRWIGDWVLRHKTILGLADRGSILLIIYVAFSRSVADNIWQQVNPTDLVIVITAITALLALAIAFSRAIARWPMRLDTENEIVLVFCGSNKSLASGLPIASVLFAGGDLGLILLPLMLYHQLQLIVCAILAKRYVRRPDLETQPTLPQT